MSRRPRLKDEPQLTAEFAKLLRAGVTPEEACLRLDVALQSYKEWRRWGSPERRDGKAPVEPYRTFARETSLALADFQGGLVDSVLLHGTDARYAKDVEDPFHKGVILHKKGEIILNDRGSVARPGDWRATMAILAARFPRQFSPQVRVVLEHELTAALARIERGLEGFTLVRITKPGEEQAITRVLELLSSTAGDEDAEPGGARPPAPRRDPAEGGGTTH